MKKIGIIISILMIMAFFAGCGVNPKQNDGNVSNKQQGNTQINKDSQKGPNMQNAQNPDSKIRRELMSLLRLEQSDVKITKAQADKLITIIEDIKKKETIDTAYADTKAAEIESILSKEQKEYLAKKPGNQLGGRKGNINDGNNGSQGPRSGNMPDGKNIPQGQMPRPDGEKNNFGGGRGGFDIKTLCERMKETLKKIN